MLKHKKKTDTSKKNTQKDQDTKRRQDSLDYGYGDKWIWIFSEYYNSENWVLHYGHTIFLLLSNQTHTALNTRNGVQNWHVRGGRGKIDRLRIHSPSTSSQVSRVVTAILGRSSSFEALVLGDPLPNAFLLKISSFFHGRWVGWIRVTKVQVVCSAANENGVDRVLRYVLVDSSARPRVEVTVAEDKWERTVLF
jgi:hypothetical protein